MREAYVKNWVNEATGRIPKMHCVRYASRTKNIKKKTKLNLTKAGTLLILSA